MRMLAAHTVAFEERYAASKAEGAELRAQLAAVSAATQRREAQAQASRASRRDATTETIASFLQSEQEEAARVDNLLRELRILAAEHERTEQRYAILVRRAGVACARGFGGTGDCDELGIDCTEDAVEARLSAKQHAFAGRRRLAAALLKWYVHAREQRRRRPAAGPSGAVRGKTLHRQVRSTQSPLSGYHHNANIQGVRRRRFQ